MAAPQAAALTTWRHPPRNENLSNFSHFEFSK